MCARLLACPLCSQPGFRTLDALRMGLVSVATRPLACPVCNEVLLGIDKLTIHLFGHTVAEDNAAVGGGNESAKIMEVTSAGNAGVQAIVCNTQTIPVQSWNVLKTAQASLETSSKRQLEEAATEPTATNIYIPIDEIEAFRNLTTLKDDAGNVIPVTSSQVNKNGIADMKTSSQVIFLQNVQTQPKIFSTNLINQINQTCNQKKDEIHTTIPIKEIVDQAGKKPYTQFNVEFTFVGTIMQSSWVNNANTEPSQVSDYPPSHTDRLADLVKNAQITASPLGNFHESFDSLKSETPPEIPSKPLIKSTRILSASERTERCNICGFHFPDRNILVLHKQLVHMAKEKNSNVASEDLMKNYPCHLCTKVFKMRGSLMVHMRVAHSGFNSSATVKEPSYKTEQGRDTSKETDISSSNEHESGYNCPTCGKNFKKEQHVTQHLKIHEGKQWECDVCGKMFTTKYFLKKHKRLHSGEMPYKCNICDKTFTFQQSYHKHRLYHKDDKPHTCSTCSRSFKELSTLHNHERIHTGEKPFACETCGKCFRQRVSYLVHRRIHTGVMPYKCTMCGKSFRYKVSQRTHKCQQQSYGSNNFVDDLLDMSATRETQELSSQDEQSVDTPITNEENQYVLVLNDDGQHILKRKLDVDNTNEQNILNININEQNKENSNESNEFIRNLWNDERFNKMEYKNNSKVAEIISNNDNNSNLWDKTSKNKINPPIFDNKISKEFNIKETNDFTKRLWNQTSTNEVAFEKKTSEIDSNTRSNFFSMVVSPIENEMSSPSTEMKHLRLSSPVNNHQENSCQTTDCFSSITNHTNAIRTSRNNAEENFNQNNVDMSTLQTINEDSLKELLNSITDK
ncbi:PREDICTED: myoneurin [Ceratosolen solmsi marchali]|uniref:Myoneurin n=1 Tax=Ceratosolen solmsi marchali TaxID=326594 RepID=A0AAJ6YRK6_9HYME|nr:PREDICTED: myoneurin [Ceratosolen solmsi marchali]